MNFKKSFKIGFVYFIKKLSILILLSSFVLPDEKNSSFKLSLSSDIDSWWISNNNFGKNLKKIHSIYIILKLLKKLSLKSIFQIVILLMTCQNLVKHI